MICSPAYFFFQDLKWTLFCNPSPLFDIQFCPFCFLTRFIYKCINNNNRILKEGDTMHLSFCAGKCSFLSAGNWSLNIILLLLSSIYYTKRRSSWFFLSSVKVEEVSGLFQGFMPGPLIFLAILGVLKRDSHSFTNLSVTPEVTSWPQPKLLL